jgi:transposase
MGSACLIEDVLTNTIGRSMATSHSDAVAGVGSNTQAPMRCTASPNPGPRSTPERVRVQLCRELIADVRRLDQQLADNQAEATRLLDEHGTRLCKIDGVGPVLAARILGRTGHVSRFATAAAYATFNGTAPVEVASAEHECHRLNRYGDRQLNSAIHTIAVVQVRMPHSAGRRYYDRKIADGKTGLDTPPESQPEHRGDRNFASQAHRFATARYGRPTRSRTADRHISRRTTDE